MPSGRERRAALRGERAKNQTMERAVITTTQPVNGQVVSAEGQFGDGLNKLVPCCGLGCIVLFINNEIPSCFGCRLAGDMFCCAIEQSCCRILREDSHPDLKTHPNDWCMCYRNSLHLGECKTCCACAGALCCLDGRCAIPTNPERTNPFIINCFGFTLCYELSCPCFCCQTIEFMKQRV